MEHAHRTGTDGGTVLHLDRGDASRALDVAQRLVEGAVPDSVLAPLATGVGLAAVAVPEARIDAQRDAGVEARNWGLKPKRTSWPLPLRSQTMTGWLASRSSPSA